MSQNQDSKRQQGHSVQYVTLYDPFVMQTLQSVMGEEVVVQTKDGSIRGIVADVKPDHTVIQSNGSSFFIRIQEIIWIMPK